nr:reverse transcriptase domain-containing protein [Tanacetum cinerariifolium]
MVNLEFYDTHNMVAYLQNWRKFWQSTTTRTLDNGEMKITATIDGKVKEQFSSNMETALICLATNRVFNFSKMIFDVMVKNLDNETASTSVDVRHGGAATTVTSLDAGQGNAKVLADTAKRNVQTYTRRRGVITGSGEVSTASRMIISIAGASLLVSTAGMVDKYKELKKLSFDEIKELFKATMRSINDFVPMETEGRASVLAAGSSQAAVTESIEDGVLEQRMNVEALQTKYLIIDWEIYTKDTRKYWKTIRVGNQTEAYQFFKDMLKMFDRDDLKLQRHMHDPLTWRLYDTCGVHYVSIEKGMDIFMLIEKEYPLSKGLMTVMLVNKLLVDQHSEMANEPEKQKFFNDLRHYFWDEPFLFKQYADRIIQRCVARDEAAQILQQCHSEPSGWNHGIATTARKSSKTASTSQVSFTMHIDWFEVAMPVNELATSPLGMKHFESTSKSMKYLMSGG